MKLDKKQNLVIRDDIAIYDALTYLEKAAGTDLVVVDEFNKVIGALSDGDVRRFLLKNQDLKVSVKNAMSKNPLVFSEGDSSECRKVALQDFGVTSAAIVDSEGILKGIEILGPNNQPDIIEVAAFIMAGGFGTRLHPLTKNCPKPMLPIGGRPMLEIIIANLRRQGFKKIFISLHYLPDIIRDHFLDGSKFGVDIEYVFENEPLGTGGALSLLAGRLNGVQHILMLNGDVLTNANFRSVLENHKQSDFDMTMCLKSIEHAVDFGVVESDIEGRLLGFKEKPVFRYDINTGIYLFRSRVVELVNKNERIDMPDLFSRAKISGASVGVTHLHEYWLDIGRRSDYERAKHDYMELLQN